MIKKICPIIVFIFYIFINSFSFAQTTASPYVKVQGRQIVADFTGNGNYQPYIIRGAGYSPTPIGRYSSDAGYNAMDADPNQTSTNPSNLPSNIYDDPNILNRDFLNLQGMNANTVRIWKGDNTKEVGPGTVSDKTFENAFPMQPSSYGDNIFSWLLQNNYIDSSGNVIADLNSSTIVSALEQEFTDPGEFYIVKDVLELALNGDANPNAFPNAITERTLTTAGTYGLKVIAGFYVAPFGTLNCSTTPCTYSLLPYNPDSNDPDLGTNPATNTVVPFDLTNPYITYDILLRFEEYVNTYKNDPNILFWAIGNENNLSLNPNDPVQIEAWYSLVNQMAGAAHQIEGVNYHPVAVVNGDAGDTGPTGDLQFIGNSTYGTQDQTLSNVDIWGTNIYRGQSFGDYFVQYKPKSAKPLWISEYGIDAWQSCDTVICDPNNPYGSLPAILNQPANDESDQATWDGALWNEIAGNGDIAIGATIMEYSDEWWKPYDWICSNPPLGVSPYNFYPPIQGDAAYCHLNHFYFGEGPGSNWGTPLPGTSAPDGYFNEAWFGLMGISNTSPEIQPDTMTPRQAYFKLLGEFASNAAIPSYIALPIPGTTLNSSSVTFAWSLGRGVTQYQLSVGTTPGGDDIFPSTVTTATSLVVSGIHTQPVYVQLGSFINGAWQFNNYTYPTVVNNITASAGIGGTISPLGTVAVNSGTNQTFTVIPNADYSVSQVLVDGLPLNLPLTNNIYTFSNVTAAHTIAVSFTQAPAAVPGAPTMITAVAWDAQATVTFSGAVPNGSAITNYTVTSSPGGLTVTGTANSIIVPGLTDGTAYTFTVTATNAVGTSAASLPSNSVIPMGVPTAPTTVTAVAGNAQATVTFSGALPNGSAINSYTVTSFPGGISNTGAASPITVAGLTNGTAYTFTVTATNAVGTSLASSPSNSVTPTAPATVPTAPTTVTAVAGNAQAIVTFSGALPNGSAINSYTVTSSPGGIIETGATSPITVTGLTNGTTYAFTVTATNTVGTSSPSSSSNTVTPTAPATVPTAPTTVTAVAGNAQATVTFSGALSNGSAITSYTVISSPGGLTGTGTSSPITVTGLTNGTAYTFSVIAINSVGPSLASLPSNSVIPVGISGPLTVSITSPANNASFTTSKNGFINITINATAKDTNGMISKVSFFNGSTLLGTVTSSPYTLRVNNVPPGNYSLTAVASDNSGATTTSSAVAITVSGLPVVNLTADNISSAAPATVNLTATASEANGNISKVEFYDGSTLLDTVTSSPYNYTRTNVPAGKYVVTAAAYDDNNHMTISNKVIVVVNGLPVVSVNATVNKFDNSTMARVTLTATASEVDGTISKVDFYYIPTSRAPILLGTDTTKPYRYKDNHVLLGSYRIAAVVTDSNHNVTISKVIVVNVGR